MARGFLLGISGPTSSGKTSIAKSLCEIQQAKLQVYSQDDYYYSEDDPRHTRLSQFNNYINWELHSAFDMSKLSKDLQNSREALSVLEGITIFEDPDCYSLCQLRFFLTLDYATCKERRSHRSYYPFEPDPSGYFDAIIWPSHEEYKKFIMESKKDFHFLDGRDSISKNVSVILDVLRKERPDLLAV